jgi:hypothetical protein
VVAPRLRHALNRCGPSVFARASLHVRRRWILVSRRRCGPNTGSRSGGPSPGRRGTPPSLSEDAWIGSHRRRDREAEREFRFSSLILSEEKGKGQGKQKKSVRRHAPGFSASRMATMTRSDAASCAGPQSVHASSP